MRPTLRLPPLLSSPSKRLTTSQIEKGKEIATISLTQYEGGKNSLMKVTKKQQRQKIATKINLFHGFPLYGVIFLYLLPFFAVGNVRFSGCREGGAGRK